MLKLKPHEIESYLNGKGLAFRRCGRKAELRLCPFCDGGDHNDQWTCVVYLDETGGNYKCMRGNCDATGSFWTLAEKLGDDPKDFYEKDSTWKPSKRDRQEAIIPALRPVISFTPAPEIEPAKLTAEALEYLKKRGFTEEVLDAAPIWCDEKGNINLGYYHEGELCMVKCRLPRKPKEKEQKAWQAWKGGLRTLYRLEQADLDAGYLIITFGEYDALAVAQANIANAVSVPCGDQDLEWINVCYEKLKDIPEIVLWPDNDESGRTAVAKIAARLGPRKSKLVNVPYKDANEMLLKEQKAHGAEAAYQAMYDAIESAQWLYAGDVMQFSDIPDPDDSFDGYRTGFPVLDTYLGGALKGRMVLHSGSNKAGKSTAINQITAQVIEQGGRACIYAGEDDAPTYKYNLSVHLAGYEGIIKRVSASGANYSEVRPEYKDAINRWAFGRLFVIGRGARIDEDSIIDNFQLAFERYGCDFFVVDNLMKLVAGKDTANVNFRQAQVINKLSDFAKITGAHVAVIVHTNKTDDERDPPKSSASISGAKEIVNLCDAAVNWWRIPDDLKHDYDGKDAVCTILENRAFGLKGSDILSYDWQIKSYAPSRADLIHFKYHLGVNDETQKVTADDDIRFAI